MNIEGIEIPDNRKCCTNCEHAVLAYKGNHYNDIECFCLFSLSLKFGWDRDIEKGVWISPGGKESRCNFEKRTGELDIVGKRWEKK